MKRLSRIILCAFFLGFTQISVSQVNNSVIEGRVTDTDGRPLPGTGITIEHTFFGVHADSDGFYSFTGLKDGNYELRFSFVGYESKSVSVVLNDRAVQNVTLAAKTFITDDVIVNATRAGERTPLAYSTISRELLKKQNNGHDLPYLLSLTPSLVETSEAGNGVGYTSLRIRGTEGSRINVTIDGIPLNDPESQQVFWVDLPDLAASVENIQIQRGAGTSSNGAGAFGATISIETSNPDSEPLAEISTSAGSFNTYKNMISASTGLLAGKFALQMRYSDLKSDGYIERTGSDHRSAFISSVYRSGRSRLKANIILGEEHTGIGWWGVPAEMLSVNRRYNPAGEYTDQNGRKSYYENETDNYKQNHYQLIYSLKLNSKIIMNSALHYTKGEGYYEEYRNAQSFTDYGLLPISIGDSVISETDMVRRKWMSNDFYGLVYSLKYKDNGIEAVLGGGTNIYYGDHYGKVIWMRHAGSIENDYRWYLNQAIKGESSIYGKVNYSLSDRTTIFGDVQYRHVFYNMTGIDSDMKDISQEHRFNFLNPKAGVFFSITPDQDAYLSFSVANREPTRSDFKEAAGDETATPKPETLYDTELGYKLRTNISSLAINLYSMIYKDQLVPTGQLSDVGYSIMTNVKNSYRMGVELSAGIKPSKIIAWNMNLTLSRNKIADFTEYYVDYNTNDWSSAYLNKNLGEVDIAYSPSVVGTSNVTVSIIPHVDFHFISKYVGKQYFDNTMSSDRMIDPYFINNIRFDYTPKVKNVKGLEFQILVNNIFNEIYESNAYGGNWYEDGQEKTWSYYFPQAGINYMFKAGLTF